MAGDGTSDLDLSWRQRSSASVYGEETCGYLDAADPSPKPVCAALLITRILFLADSHNMFDGLVPACCCGWLKWGGTTVKTLLVSAEDGGGIRSCMGHRIYFIFLALATNFQFQTRVRIPFGEGVKTRSVAIPSRAFLLGRLRSSLYSHARRPSSFALFSSSSSFYSVSMASTLSSFCGSGLQARFTLHDIFGSVSLMVASPERQERWAHHHLLLASQGLVWC